MTERGEKQKMPTEQEHTHQEEWDAVDRYIVEKLVGPDAVLDEALQANAAAGLPSIDVAPNQGKLLHVLALTKGARRILEIGTLGGYSTIWLARALPGGGRLVTLEVEPKHAQVAQANLDRAGLAGVVEIRVGPAADSLAALCDEHAEPFDLIFIDADKKSIPAYLDWALKLARVGTLIVTDNVVREGAIVDAANPDPDVQGVRAMFEKIAAEPRLAATAIQTVGSKGWDGFALAVVVK
jgi:predicted O-methyltransferase YrrM